MPDSSEVTLIFNGERLPFKKATLLNIEYFWDLYSDDWYSDSEDDMGDEQSGASFEAILDIDGVSADSLRFFINYVEARKCSTDAAIEVVIGAARVAEVIGDRERVPIMKFFYERLRTCNLEDIMKIEKDMNLSLLHGNFDCETFALRLVEIVDRTYHDAYFVNLLMDGSADLDSVYHQMKFVARTKAKYAKAEYKQSRTDYAAQLEQLIRMVLFLQGFNHQHYSNNLFRLLKMHNSNPMTDLQRKTLAFVIHNVHWRSNSRFSLNLIGHLAYLIHDLSKSTDSEWALSELCPEVHKMTVQQIAYINKALSLKGQRGGSGERYYWFSMVVKAIIHMNGVVTKDYLHLIKQCNMLAKVEMLDKLKLSTDGDVQKFVREYRAIPTSPKRKITGSARSGVEEKRSRSAESHVPRHGPDFLRGQSDN